MVFWVWVQIKILNCLSFIALHYTQQLPFETAHCFVMLYFLWPFSLSEWRFIWMDFVQYYYIQCRQFCNNQRTINTADRFHSPQNVFKCLYTLLSIVDMPSPISHTILSSKTLIFETFIRGIYRGVPHHLSKYSIRISGRWEVKTNLI